jgi:hypothetical protein
MSVPVPLGVRFYSIVNPGEWWVTRWVEDLTFRSVVPGGFASATITLHIPRSTQSTVHADQLGFSRINELFGRVQIVDLRSLEVAWEGRIEDPARKVDPNTWEIGALGSMVAATDVKRPVFYVDSSLDGWVPNNRIGDDGSFQTVYRVAWDSSTDTDNNKLVTKYNTNLNISDAARQWAWRWASHGYDQAIARFTTTHNGNTSNSGQNSSLFVILGINANTQIDKTTFNSSTASTKTNVIGTDYTDANTRYILFGAFGSSTPYLPSSGEVMQITAKDPKVVAVRMDRTGTHLTTAANYPGDYVTVSQVVEDVVGRFLVGGWYEGGSNTPWPGSVRSTDAYIDTSDTTHILHLIYPDGATAADILNDLAEQVQTNAYWAIWESAWKAGSPGTDFGTNSGFRFEWTKWPNNWGYLATSQDGFEGQPNGDDVWNFVFYRYPDTGDLNQPHVLTSWLTDDMTPELLTGGITRAVTVNKSDPTDGGTAGTLGDAYLASKKKVQNAGTLTVKRPIQFYDPGANSNSGGGRLVDPWMIRPGKLIRITDLPPRAGSTDMSYGATAPTDALNGTIFRVVATEYQTSDNSCRLELDQVATWQIPTQISDASSGSKTIRIQ